ncbi:trk system potassium uptake protein TrkA [Natronobacillus azotifigens]|uniref:TrkA family potassium uptake protein n=1 Tax=Natronobacillus azotifigens TaxID=472978 RepID=A0A9J6R826_9BACI|nr:TrkA family potassium uptake protein [Natronobacillus azotifigens]
MKQKQIAVIGLGQFGGGICKELARLGHDVLVIDKEERLVNDYSKIATHAVVADTTDEELLHSLGLRNFDYVIVAIGEDIQASILTTIILKDMGATHVWVKARNSYHHKILNKIGADLIIHPEKDIGKRLAQRLKKDQLFDFIEISDEYSIVEINTTNKLSNKSLLDLNISSRYGLTILGVKKNGKLNINPAPELDLDLGNVLFIIGNNLDIQRFKKVEL